MTDSNQGLWYGMFAVSLLLALACGDSTGNDPAAETDAPSVAANTPPRDAPYTDIEPEEAFATTLQGRFRRVDYPHGTIEVEGRQIKVTPGEGAVEPATFENYELARSCPRGGAAAVPGAYYVIYGDGQRCDAFVMRGDTLQLVLPEGQGRISYLREG